MTGLLYGLGKLCVRRRWVVLGVWVLIFVALLGWSRALGTDVNDNLTLPGTDSQAATDLLSERFPSQANGINPVVLRAPGGEKITASKFKTPIDDTVKALKADPDVRSATNPLSSDGKANLVEAGEHRLHRAQPEAEPERALGRRRGADRRARRSGAPRRADRRLRRLPRARRSPSPRPQISEVDRPRRWR